MTRWLVLYEDPHAADLSPLTDLVPVPGLTFGASTLGGRWRDIAGVPLLAVVGRELTLAAWRGRPAPELSKAPARDDDVLVINAAVLPGEWFGALLAAAPHTLCAAAGRIAGAHVTYGTVERGLGHGEGFERFLLEQRLTGLPVEASFLAWPWDLVQHNVLAIEHDLTGRPAALAGDIDPGAVLYRPERVHVERDARVDALAVLDAREGPVLIRRGARVAPHTWIAGPCVIGEDTQVLCGAVSRSSVGPGCRIQGEVEESVWQGFANKRHHGFVGHSWIGEWVNLGALTTTSDLKNNYGAVRVWAAGAMQESGLTKVGAFVGAHVKTGIGTLLPTGASVGTGSNLFGGGRFAPRRVAPFAWWDGERAVEHRLDAFLDTARHAMARRGRPMDAADERVLRRLFETARTADNAGASAIAPRANAAS
jgi:UDP-N-acetylglucosamine diphosphorylase/glucosamine-1-phosphate N-acetyltransferase